MRGGSSAGPEFLFRSTRASGGWSLRRLWSVSIRRAEQARIQPGDVLVADTRPGLNPRRLTRLMRSAIDRCSLDLSGRTVLTEAATGAYVVTAVLAAMAGAEVYALAAATAYASSDELRALTTALAETAGVSERVVLTAGKCPEIIGAADIVTNSGQVRPIDVRLVSLMKESAVIPLMYESWEYRSSDVDLTACRARGIPVAGTNERHPAVDVFSFLGPMAVKQLHDAGVAVYRSTIVLLCDNPFAPFIVRGLEGCGAAVHVTEELSDSVICSECDAVIVANHPREDFVLKADDAALLAESAPGVIVVEYWGDTDRDALADAGVSVWPPEPSKRGHMAVLPSAVGPEPIVRLQAGGLKVGEVLARGLGRVSDADLDYVQVL